MIACVALAIACSAASPDSLTLDELLARVRASHPQARQAAALREQARADLRAARGAFDPSVSATWDYKRFKGLGYYDEFDARLTVPTPWGVDVKVGWERAAGAIINPERATPGGGLLSAGLAIPIGPRLLTDERRTGVQQAEVAAEAAEAEADAALQRLMLQVARDWSAWYEAEERLRIAGDGVSLARFRLDAVRSRTRAGDAAAIDSLEALAEWERRVLLEVEARAAAAGARLGVAAHLWDDAGRAVALAPAARPVLAPTAAVSVDDADFARLARGHPAAVQARARWLQVEAQRRLVLTQVLPSASAEVSALAEGRSLGALPPLDAVADDAKAAMAVRLPLFARRELGRLRAVEARARQLAAERDRVQREVVLAAERAAVELRAVEAQRAGQQRVLEATAALLAAEQRRYDIGESTLLLVNLRERAVLDERLRAAQLEARRIAARAALAVALGTTQLSSGTNTPSAR